jgi:hypothetical protein
MKSLLIITVILWCVGVPVDDIFLAALAVWLFTESRKDPSRT